LIHPLVIKCLKGTIVNHARHTFLNWRVTWNYADSPFKPLKN